MHATNKLCQQKKLYPKVHLLYQLEEKNIQKRAANARPVGTSKLQTYAYSG